MTNSKYRSYFFQGLFLIAIISFIAFLANNARSNLESQNIATGFDFLKAEAGFEISETPIEYSSASTYGKALWVGVLNTIKIAIIGNILAISLGILIGVLGLSSNFLVSFLSKCYIEIIRNVPLLLHLLFIYSIFTDILPSVRSAFSPISGVFFSNRGVNIPRLVWHESHLFVLSSLFLICLIVFIGIYQSLQYKKRTGENYKWTKFFPLLFLLPVLVWLVTGAHFNLELPELRGFNFGGGITISPEYIALLLGLVLYTGAFNAEIIRSGIQSVKQGQWEAAKSVGLKGWQVMLFIILPQALRAIIPPITSQILNLTKNSSLAVAIAYPDFVSIANTSMNQTGQAIELVCLIMIMYLFFSLLTSFIMNIYNKKMSLENR